MVNCLAVRSSAMDFLLVFPLILAILSTGQSNAQVTSSCFTECPPGFHKDGDCADKQLSCKRCGNETFTEVANSLTKCHRCRSCGHYEMEIKPCLPDSDVECDCKEGYYNTSNYSDRRDCKLCPRKPQSDKGKSKRLKRRGAVDESDIWKRCLNTPECLRKCNAASPLSPTSPHSTTTTLETPSATTTTASAASTSSSNSTGPVMHPMTIYSVHHMFLLFAVPVVVFLALFWILLLLTRNPSRYPDSCPCWRVNKALEPPVEEPMFNDQHSHHVSSPTTQVFTQTLNISEETPMMPLNQSPAPSEYSAHVGPVLLDAQHKAAGQDEQSEHWPAIVLYAIIKEVPLRRWKEFLRLLSVADQQLERVELETGFGLGSIERQYQMLRLWSQRSTSSLNDVFSALRYMDLSGCAQLLQESLERLQWRPELKQGCTDHGAMQDT